MFRSFKNILIAAAAGFLSPVLSASSTFGDLKITSVQDLLKEPLLRTREQRKTPVIQLEWRSPFYHQAPERHFYVQGGLHGNERLTSTFVWWLAKQFQSGNSAINKIEASRIRITLVPIANPDGYNARLRSNAALVNLNRNFSAFWGISKENPGSQPFSEKETQAIRKLFEQNHFDAAVDVHGYVNWIVGPSEPAGADKLFLSQKLKLDRWHQILEDESKALLAGYEFKTALGLGDGGAFEDWAFWKQGVPALCLEMASEERFVRQKNGSGQLIDTFKNYDVYLGRVFSEATKLDNLNLITKAE